MSAPEEFPRLLSCSEAAARLGLKTDTLRLWARKGRIPSRRAGTLVIFLERELREWIEALPSAAELPRKSRSALAVVRS